MLDAWDKILLSADTTTEMNTVALTRGDSLLVETSVLCRRKHSERLLETVDWVLKEAELTLDAVDCLAISNGPGSFTGLRIGAATWKGLAFALDKPLVAVPTLDAMALSAPLQEGRLLVALDARMGEVFGALYQVDKRGLSTMQEGDALTSGGLQKLQEDAVAPIEAFLQDVNEPLYCIGDGALLYQKAIHSKAPDAIIAPAWLSFPRAAAIGIHACQLLAQGVAHDPALCNPIYLRKSQAEINREKRLLEA